MQHAEFSGSENIAARLERNLREMQKMTNNRSAFT